MGITPTQRTLKALRDRGLLCHIVEKFNPHAGPFGIRQDCFGFIDIIALDEGRGIIGVQSTGQAFNSHKNKIIIDKEIECKAWLLCGGKVELWGWRKLKAKRGGKAMRWKPRIADFYLDGDKIYCRERS